MSFPPRCPLLPPPGRCPCLVKTHVHAIAVRANLTRLEVFSSTTALLQATWYCARSLSPPEIVPKPRSPAIAVVRGGL
eukprot:scaffold1430_cov257-Pinguiococcus_pyrenoidosus.AAC.13